MPLPQSLPEVCGDLRRIPPLQDDSYELRQVQVIIRYVELDKAIMKMCSFG